MSEDVAGVGPDWVSLRYHEENLREFINHYGGENLHDSLTALCAALPSPETTPAGVLPERTGQPPEDTSGVAGILHDNGFTWDDANAVDAILSHFGLIASKSATPAGVVDEAWAAAEKALPEGWSQFRLTLSRGTGDCIASVHDGSEAAMALRTGLAIGSGPTPAAALHALAAALGRSGSGGGRSRAEPAGIRLMGYYEGRRANPCPHTAIEPQRPAPNAPECTCEGEFVWACGPECMCVHHEKAVDDELPNYADDEYNGRLPWSQ